MRPGIHSVIVAAVMLLSPAAFAQEAGIKAIDTVLLQGKASIGTKAPPDWAPIRTPNNMGLCVAYVLDGRSFDDSPSVIYPRLVGSRSIEDLVSESAAHYKTYSPAFRLEEKKDYQSRNGQTFTIRYFLNGPNPNAFEAVGYLAHKGQVLLIVYSSLKRNDFDDHIAGFFSALDHVTPYSTEMNALSGSCLIPRNQ